MAETITIELPYIPPAELRGNKRGSHWNERKAKLAVQHSMMEHWHLATNDWEGTIHWEKAKITYEWHHWRKVDRDNLLYGMKHIQDVLQPSIKASSFEGGYVNIPAIGLIPNDDPDHLVHGEHRFAKCKKGESKTIITLERLS